MSKLNYHHLYYFWQVAKDGNLTRTAKTLHVSQSALSSQIKQLECNMSVRLFRREGRKLLLTETGQRTFSYADEIFKKGDELESLLLSGIEPESRIIRIGALSTMSRNFIEDFITPLIGKSRSHFSVHAGGQGHLLNALANHQLDLVLTNIAVHGDDGQLWQCQLLARQPIAVVGPPGSISSKTFSSQYKKQRWVLPVSESPIRSAFDSFCVQRQFTPDIVAEADDMAMLRLLARDSGALAVIPDVVVRDELNSNKLVHFMTLPNAYENFYGVTVKRQFSSELISELFSRWLDDVTEK